MKVLIQNLQKRECLGTQLSEKYDPDVMLVQEINLNSEINSFVRANNVSSMSGVGSNYVT